jgi:hypothetical protein
MGPTISDRVPGNRDDVVKVMSRSSAHGSMGEQ